MPEARQRVLGELAVSALSGELGPPRGVASATGRHVVWETHRAGRPILTVQLMLEPNGGSYPVRVLIGDPDRPEGERVEIVTLGGVAEITGVVQEIHRRLGGA